MKLKEYKLTKGLVAIVVLILILLYVGIWILVEGDCASLYCWIDFGMN